MNPYQKKSQKEVELKLYEIFHIDD
ncbi:uncharacterized protein METZ01_LOCUS200850 [marine metagenome]|uniref:Uncharacterized protein n=1 Tax=marine metagenome TaxID=408172 RepID=A0A382EB13_9ZZZZ